MATMRSATVRTVADRAGVAVSSVSRVLSGHPDVSDSMREKVLKAAEELGYEPDLLARSLREGVTHTVGFVVADISNPLFGDIASGAETTLRNAGYSMLLTNSEADSNADLGHIQLLSRRRVDGLMLSLASEDDPEVIRALTESSLPYVLIDREIVGDSGCAVLSDHRKGMREAVSMLLGLGHRRIGLVLGPRLRFTRERLAGVEDAYRELGVEPDLIVHEGKLDEVHGRRGAAALFEDARPPTAIITGGNQLLAGTLGEVRRRGLSLPGDLSLISCDDVALAQLMLPRIAVVRRDTRLIGETAAELLLGRLRGEGANRTVLLPTEFISRESVGPPGG
jgi:LacI family transcriptional regulator, galactose operon repressor